MEQSNRMPNAGDFQENVTHEELLRDQVRRVNKVDSGDLDGVYFEDVELYVAQVGFSIKNLEALADPYTDEDYDEELAELEEEEPSTWERANNPGDMVNYLNERFRLVIDLLHREDVL